MRLCFIRHGESEANVLRVISNRGQQSIFFDLDDTILTDTVNAAACWRAACERYAPRANGPSVEALLAGIAAARQWYWSDPERHRAGRLDLNQAREDAGRIGLRRLGIDDPALAHDLSETNTALRDAMMRPFPGAIDTLSALRQQGVPR